MTKRDELTKTVQTDEDRKKVERNHNVIQAVIDRFFDGNKPEYRITAYNVFDDKWRVNVFDEQTQTFPSTFFFTYSDEEGIKEVM